MNNVRKTRPTAGNKYYIRRASGGYSGCIQGSPTDSQCDVLANCVGYCNGATNEQKGEGREVYPLTCNAENFIERGIAYGLSVYKSPEVGDCLVWQKGATLSGSDGAGHVAQCTDVLERNSDGTAKVIITSESGYGSSKPFWRTQRTNANGKWGAGSGYTFRGCLRIPGYKPTEVTPNVDKNIYKNQIEVLISDLRVRSDAGTDKPILGFASKGYYNYYDTKDANGYKWYKIADGQWIASKDGWTNVYPAQPKPTPTYKYKIGDKVVINGALYVSANAASPSGSVSNKVTNITRIAEGTAHPYNTTGDLGWMNESDIQPYVEPTPTTERKGLDLSSYQAGISFDAIKNSEYNKFVILRGGFTGWGTGVNYNKDSSFETFYSEAKAKGIPVGCYWYSCANTYDKGVAEANFLYDNCLKGKQFEYPIYIDVEDSHWQVDNKDGVTSAIKGFCETLEAKKYYVGIYASDISGFKEKMYIDQLTAYDKWVARYGSAPQYVTSYGMWQTSSEGKISGYSGNLDTDIAYKDYETMIKEAKLNGYGDEPAPPTPPTPPTPTYKYKIGDKVVLNGQLYGDADGGHPGQVVSNKVTNITRIAEGHPYPYNTTGDLGWMAESSISPYVEPTPTPTELKVGDKVKIVGTGKASSYGDNPTAGGIGWNRYILKIYNGRPYPYQVGANGSTTGFYKASALQKL